MRRPVRGVSRCGRPGRNCERPTLHSDRAAVVRVGLLTLKQRRRRFAICSVKRAQARRRHCFGRPTIFCGLAKHAKRLAGRGPVALKGRPRCCRTSLKTRKEAAIAVAIHDNCGASGPRKKGREVAEKRHRLDREENTLAKIAPTDYIDSLGRRGQTGLVFLEKQINHSVQRGRPGENSRLVVSYCGRVCGTRPYCSVFVFVIYDFFVLRH